MSQLLGPWLRAFELTANENAKLGIEQAMKSAFNLIEIFGVTLILTLCGNQTTWAQQGFRACGSTLKISSALKTKLAVKGVPTSPLAEKTKLLSRLSSPLDGQSISPTFGQGSIAVGTGRNHSGVDIMVAAIASFSPSNFPGAHFPQKGLDGTADPKANPVSKKRDERRHASTSSGINPSSNHISTQSIANASFGS